MDVIASRHKQFKDTYEVPSDHDLRDFFLQYYSIEPMLKLLEDKQILYSKLGVRCMMPPLTAEDVIDFMKLRPESLRSALQSEYCDCLDYCTFLKHIFRLEELNCLHSLLLVECFLLFCISPTYGVSLFYTNHESSNMQETHNVLVALNNSIHEALQKLSRLLISLKWDSKMTSNQRQVQGKHMITDAILVLAKLLKNVDVATVYKSLDFRNGNEMYARGALNPIYSYPFVVALFDMHVFSYCLPMSLRIHHTYTPIYPHRTIYLAELTSDTSTELQHMLFYFSKALNFNHAIDYNDKVMPYTMHVEMKRWLLFYSDTNSVLQKNNESKSNYSFALGEILKSRKQMKMHLDTYTSMIFKAYWENFTIMYQKFSNYYTVDKDKLGEILIHLQQHIETECAQNSICFTFSTVPFWAQVLRQNQISESVLPTFEVRTGEYTFKSVFPHIVTHEKIYN